MWLGTSKTEITFSHINTVRIEVVTLVNAGIIGLRDPQVVVRFDRVLTVQFISHDVRMSKLVKRFYFLNTNTADRSYQ